MWGACAAPCWFPRTMFRIYISLSPRGSFSFTQAFCPFLTWFKSLSAIFLKASNASSLYYSLRARPKHSKTFCLRPAFYRTPLDVWWCELVLVVVSGFLVAQFLRRWPRPCLLGEVAHHRPLCYFGGSPKGWWGSHWLHIMQTHLPSC